MIGMPPATPTTDPLARLSDDALVRILPWLPVLDEEAASALESAATKLLAHFQREGRLTTHAVATVAEGAALVVAWEGPVLSGCSHDKLNALAAHHQSARRCLDLPPISLRCGYGWRCGTRADLRMWIAAGEADATSIYLDRTVTDLGTWRTRGLVPLAESPLARLLA